MTALASPDHLHPRRPSWGRRGRGCRRTGLGDGGELPLVGKVEVDLPAGAAPVEGELSVLGPENVPIKPAVRVQKGVLTQDSLGNDLSERARISPGGAVIHADGAPDGQEARERVCLWCVVRGAWCVSGRSRT